MTVWQEPGEEVDLMMDLRNLTFKENSIDEIYAFHVLDHLFLEEIPRAIESWRKCLKSGGKIYFVVDDFEIIARQFVSGDFAINDFNKNFSHPTQFTKENMVDFLANKGFVETKIVIWYDGVKTLIDKAPHELVMSAEKI